MNYNVVSSRCFAQYFLHDVVMNLTLICFSFCFDSLRRPLDKDVFFKRKRNEKRFENADRASEKDK